MSASAGAGATSIMSALLFSSLALPCLVTLACEDANSKLVEVVNVADVDAADHVGYSLLQIWKLRFSHKA